jgi:hypothetical protein
MNKTIIINKISMILIYIAFYSCIAFVCCITKSAWPLIGLIATPSVSFISKD